MGANHFTVCFAMQLSSPSRSSSPTRASSDRSGRDRDALIDQRNHLMREASRYSGRMPSSGDRHSIGSSVVAMRCIAVEIGQIDTAIEGLLDHRQPDDRTLLKQIRRSARDLSDAMRLFEIAELENRLGSQGVTFEPGQLGAIRHDGLPGAFPVRDVMQLARLHAADGACGGGASIAVRLVMACTARIPFVAEDHPLTCLEECTRMARDLLPQLSSAEQRQLMTAESMPLLCGEREIESILSDRHLTIEDCLDRMTSSSTARLCLLLRLVNTSEPWTPSIHQLALHLQQAAMAEEGTAQVWLPMLMERMGERLAHGPAPALQPVRNLSAESENTHPVSTPDERRTMASFGLLRVCPGF